MGAQFDRTHGGRDAWIRLHAGLFAAGRRACKPGAWSLTWALPRTSHWTACALDDAGWEITDCLTHLNGQGWPKNARTQLKPASEHWYLARNGGGGSLQIDASRVARGERSAMVRTDAASLANTRAGGPSFGGIAVGTTTLGSWPTNLLLSHSDDCEEYGACSVGCPVAELDGQSGTLRAGERPANRKGAGYDDAGKHSRSGTHGERSIVDAGGAASRFFPCFAYAAKAATSERHAGADRLRWARDASTSLGWREVTPAESDALPASERGTGNIHPTVKSLKLARWLVRLLCPPGGKGGDPFCGSGSIGIAAALEGFDWISSDLSHEAIRIAHARLAHWESAASQPVKAIRASRLAA